jgi:hypothetical protein
MKLLRLVCAVLVLHVSANALSFAMSRVPEAGGPSVTSQWEIRLPVVGLALVTRPARSSQPKSGRMLAVLLGVIDLS